MRPDTLIEKRIATGRKTLSELELAWGPMSTKLISALLNLADLYFALGQFPAAEQLYTRYLNICCREFGHNDRRVAHGLRLMGEVLEAQGLNAEAERLFLMELDLQTRTKRSDRDLVDSLSRLLSFYRSQEEEFKTYVIEKRLLSCLNSGEPAMATAV